MSGRSNAAAQRCRALPLLSNFTQKRLTTNRVPGDELWDRHPRKQKSRVFDFVATSLQVDDYVSHEPNMRRSTLHTQIAGSDDDDDNLPLLIGGCVVFLLLLIY